MNDRIRMQRLKLALRVIAVFFVVGFLGFYVLVLLDSSLVAKGSLLGALLRWSPYHKAYEGMIVAIYSVWGVFLWRASNSPVENKSLIDFTIWANLAHAVQMLVAAFVLEGESMHFMGDILMLALVAACCTGYAQFPSLLLHNHRPPNTCLQPTRPYGRGVVRLAALPLSAASSLSLSLARRAVEAERHTH